ncbi:MAG: PIN domain-containing protein [Patescibacteria group bacterium]|nr:PIN domain-containing protein [Patescibacteria group bacterium]MBU4141496.1 PIN domain-containing protein [Patescibacteria group bacterium]
MNNSANKKIFLDTAFLASFSIENHPDYKKARILLTELAVNNYEMYVSPFCFYELWKVVKEYNDFSRGNWRFIRRFNKILKFIYLKILFIEINFSFKNIFNDLKICTDKVLQSKFIAVINSNKNHIEIALNAINNFDTKPGDAFHYAAIKDLNINIVITGNRREFERMGLEVRWF